MFSFVSLFSLKYPIAISLPQLNFEDFRDEIYKRIFNNKDIF